MGITTKYKLESNETVFAFFKKFLGTTIATNDIESAYEARENNKNIMFG